MQFAERLTKWCATKIELNHLQKVELKYGIELFFENFIKTAVILLLGLIFGKFYETILVLLSFCTLRYFAGGIHMRTSIGCFLFTLLIWAFCLWGGSVIYWNEVIIRYICLFNVVFVILCAPADTEKNLIQDRKIRAQKKRGAIIVVLVLVLTIVVIPLMKVKLLLLLALTAETFTILPVIGYVNKIRRRKDESL